MKLAVFSDIHSNYYALRACLEWVGENETDGIVLLGDYVSDCAYPQKTMGLLYQAEKQYKTWFISGNRDRVIAGGDIPAYLESMRYTYENLTKKDLVFLSSMPIAAEICIEGYPMISISHGDFQDERAEVLPENDVMQKLLLEMKGTLHLCGHTHLSFVYEKDGRRVVNPGSVGVPQDGTPLAKMAVLESDGGDWTVRLVSVSYDVERTVEEIHTSGLYARAGAFSRSVIATMRTGHDYREECLKLVQSYDAAAAGANACDPVLWRRAADELGI